MKFTFKKTIHTGYWRSFQPEHHYIKLNRKVVGDITRNEGKFRIRLMINKKDIMEDNNPNCVWKNIFLAKKFDTAQEAKDFLNNNIDALTLNYDLHMEEN